MHNLRRYPLAKEEIVQELAAGQRTDVRVQLHHHESCFDFSLTIRHDGETAMASGLTLLPGELEPLLTAIENSAAVPTPAGVFLDLPEPVIHHNESHRLCEVDFREMEHRPREWTRDQIWNLIDWLPRDAAKARERLHQIESSIAWRDYFQGWFWYLATGASGLAFARWATIAKLQPFRSRDAFVESIKLLIVIVLLALLLGFLASALVNSRWLRAFHIR